MDTHVSHAETVITLVNHKMMKDKGHGVLPTHAREQCQKRQSFAPSPPPPHSLLLFPLSFFFFELL
jgi:hypothetical protein